ncbi:HNH endonuclease [Pseudescherichia sp.]|uniref:HNH endonuclease n=1 Tax=Pseudescherichia sp. TaxID=2055881 RepID=UPI00289CCCF8|nr:HNH endonuclease [Pseudescherichia sp.]
MTLSKLIESEVADFFAGFGGPGEPDIQNGEAQQQLTTRLLSLLERRERDKQESGEEWRDVEGTDGNYSVSSLGRLKSNRSGKYLSTNSLIGSGYVKASLYANGQRVQTSIHRLVATAFLDKQDGKDEVNHINGNKTDNRYINLEWVSRSENVVHGYYKLGNNIKSLIAAPVDGSGPSLIFKSGADAEKYGFHSSHLYACLRGEHSQHGGYKWNHYNPAPPAPVVPECFIKFHKIIEERHHGRMPQEVQQAFDECAAMLKQQSIIQASDDAASGAEIKQPVSNSPEIPDDWVKCSERMPAPQELIYIYHPDYGVDGDVWYEECAGEFKWGDDTRGRDISTVTHWMEMPGLPAAPKQESE